METAREHDATGVPLGRTAARLWGAACTFATLWPTFVGRYGEWIEAARETLGDQFDELEAVEAELSVGDAVALADTIV